MKLQLLSLRVSLFLVVLFIDPLAYAQSIDGVWKHPDRPVWIQVNVDKGLGEVVRNDADPDRVGLALIKDLVKDGEKSETWSAQVYALKMAEYKNAEVTVPNPETLRLKVKVGFMSRTLDWIRAQESDVVSSD